MKSVHSFGNLLPDLSSSAILADGGGKSLLPVFNRGGETMAGSRGRFVDQVRAA